MARSTVSPGDELDYRKLFRSSPERKIIFKANDPDYTFVEVTDAHTRLTGVSREKLVGRNFFDLFPDVSEKYLKTGVNDLANTFRAIIRTKKPHISDVFRYDIPERNGKGYQERYWKTEHHPILDSQGGVAYILQLSSDVTNEIAAERDTRSMRDQLQDALQIGRVGSWVWDVGSDVVIADRNLAGMFGLSVREAARGISLNSFTAVIHKDDQPRVIKAIQSAIKKHTSFEEEYRTVTAKGRVRWVLARGKIEKRDGRVTFPGVIVDITERQDLLAQVELAHEQDMMHRESSQILQRRNDELEAISRTKDEFVALASHQLRTPATAVKQYLGMVLQGYVGDITDTQTDMLSKAFESNERQIQIINQILNAARVDTGRLVMSPVPVDLVELTRGISDEMRESLEQRQHNFVVKLAAKPVWVMADLGYLRMAIENLVHNACIYTPNGGTIRVDLQRSGSTTRLSISDTGVGIKKADIKKLFAKFSRIHNPLSVQAGGSGIGLYLTAEIIRLHKGEVVVESAIRKGTTFTVVLPTIVHKM